jgi:uncharacterized protein with PQ loop repeat
MLATGLALLGSAFTTTLTLPQTVRVARTGITSGLSATTQILALGSAVTWGAWSLVTHQYLAGIPSVVNGPASAYLLYRILTAKRHDGNPTNRISRGQR